MNQRTIDVHSVTCALCGELADERETISLWEDDYDDEDPVRDVVADLPDGEAHESCLDPDVDDVEVTTGEPTGADPDGTVDVATGRTERTGVDAPIDDVE